MKEYTEEKIKMMSNLQVSLCLHRKHQNIFLRKRYGDGPICYDKIFSYCVSSLFCITDKKPKIFWCMKIYDNIRI